MVSLDEKSLMEAKTKLELDVMVLKKENELLKKKNQRLGELVIQRDAYIAGQRKTIDHLSSSAEQTESLKVDFFRFLERTDRERRATAISAFASRVFSASLHRNAANEDHTPHSAARARSCSAGASIDRERVLPRGNGVAKEHGIGAGAAAETCRNDGATKQSRDSNRRSEARNPVAGDECGGAEEQAGSASHRFRFVAAAEAPFGAFGAE